jgi:hypothetical protein
MRLPLIIASILCSLVFSGVSEATPKKGPNNSRKLGLTIKVQGKGWGNVRNDAIESVLYSVADQLLSRLPQKLTVPIIVTHTDSSPVALYERGEGGEYLVQLHAQGTNWHLYTYEFAHELCHILANYEKNVGPGVSKNNQWFEETLCETASLFTLKSLAATWEGAELLPDGSMKPDQLRRFFDLLIAEGHRQLPPHTPLSAWLASNEEHLRRDPYLRKKNEVVANLLLPLFERDPENWATLSYINLDPADAHGSLSDYLSHWYQNAPDEHKAFITGVLSLFDMQGVMPVAEPAVAATTIIGLADTPQVAAGAASPGRKP